MNERKNKENPLLKIEEGETREEAIDKWWRQNGLDHEVARKQREERYLQQLKEAAIAMDRFYREQRE
jgi:hypothetical protein